MKPILILFFIVLAGYVAGAGDCSSKDNPNHVFESWMSPFGSRTFKEIVLLASHDAGTYLYDKDSKNKAIFVTQSQNIGSQLCSSYRMFDIRVRKAGGIFTKNYARGCAPGDSNNAVDEFGSWRIYHEMSNFDCVHRIASQVKVFCESHPTEVAILRIKMEHADENEKDKFFKSFAKKIGNCIIRRDLLEKNVPKTKLQDATIAQALSATVGNSASTKVATGGVILLDYSKKNLLVSGTHDSLDIVFDYRDYQVGEYSNSLDFDKIQKGQLESYEEWVKDSDKNKPTFGWWTTYTSISSDVIKSAKNLLSTITGGSLSVEDNTKEIFTNGKQQDWFKNWVAERVKNKQPVQGVTLWTDFAGDPRQTEIVRLAAQVNCNLSNGKSADDGLGPAPKDSLSTNPGCSKQSNSRLNKKSKRRSAKFNRKHRKNHQKKSQY